MAGRPKDARPSGRRPRLAARRPGGDLPGRESLPSLCLLTSAVPNFVAPLMAVTPYSVVLVGEGSRVSSH